MSRLMAYFNEVDKNAVMRAAHLSEPEASMSKFGLTVAEQVAVLSGEFEKLAGAMGTPADRLPALVIPQTIGVFGQLPAIHVPQSIAMLEQ